MINAAIAKATDAFDRLRNSVWERGRLRQRTKRNLFETFVIQTVYKTSGKSKKVVYLIF